MDAKQTFKKKKLDKVGPLRILTPRKDKKNSLSPSGARHRALIVECWGLGWWEEVSCRLGPWFLNSSFLHPGLGGPAPGRF